VRQAGQKDVDILLLPSSDCDSVADSHAQQAPFRAVENGVALARPTRQGISLATDGQGRLLGHKPDYFVSNERTLVVSVPTRGNDTWYASVGDGLAYAIAAGLLIRRRSSPTEATSSAPVTDLSAAGRVEAGPARPPPAAMAARAFHGAISGVLRYLELEDPYSHQVGRGHTFWVVKISRSLQRRPGTCAYGSAEICSNEIDAQPSDNGTSVVFVQTV